MTDTQWNIQGLARNLSQRQFRNSSPTWNSADRKISSQRSLPGEIVKGSEAGVTKNSKVLFRYAVEVELIIMILSELADIPTKVIEEYRKEAIRNVRRTRGKIDLDDLIARNN